MPLLTGKELDKYIDALKVYKYSIKDAIELTGLKKMETNEPKNVAVEILVDRLKTEQSDLNRANNGVMNYTEIKNKHEKNIRELSQALKKLGHKE